MRHEPFVADMSIEPGRRSTTLAAIDRGNQGPIDRVSTLRLSEFLMTRLAWWVVGSQLITITHCSVATARHANTTENKSRLDCNRGRALHANVSPLATYDCGHSGRDAAVSPSTAICSKRSAGEGSVSSSLGQDDHESSASSPLGQGDHERSASSSLGQDDPERSASSSLGQDNPERSASSSLGQDDPEITASSSLGQDDPESSTSSSLGQGERQIDAAAGTAKAPQYSD